MRSRLTVVPVDSHVDDRSAPVSIAVPEVGLCWGAEAQFEFDLPREEAEARRRGGMTIRWPADTKHTVLVHDFTPVWRRYDVFRVRSEEDPDTYVDVRVTREALVPVEDTTQRFVGSIGYVEDPGRYGYEERVIHTYVHLQIPSPMSDQEKVGEGTEGTWPSYPEDMFAPGRIGAELSSAAPYGSNFGWSR